ncbi:OsmC family protein [Ottowia sp.]|uniref:OsmC family protein n=1 Tax=Ottowia sp. TaxID=1898956 RepID=UPI002D0C63EA|nr:OsmC family protein [Ottowia sp.]HNR84054.1 OsmC family protein [Ottowia sp.]
MNTAIRIHLEQEGDYAFRVHFDDTALAPLLTDEPAPLGHEQGPNPARMLLAAIANCLVASLLFALRKHRNDPGRLVAEVTATPQRNEQGRWRLPTASVTLRLPGHGADLHNLDRVLAQFEDFCIVTQSVRQGIEVAVTVVDSDGAVLLGNAGTGGGS